MLELPDTTEKCSDSPLKRPKLKSHNPDGFARWSCTESPWILFFFLPPSLSLERSPFTVSPDFVQAKSRSWGPSWSSLTAAARCLMERFPAETSRFCEQAPRIALSSKAAAEVPAEQVRRLLLSPPLSLQASGLSVGRLPPLFCALAPQLSTAHQWPNSAKRKLSPRRRATARCAGGGGWSRERGVGVGVSDRQ